MDRIIGFLIMVSGIAIPVLIPPVFEFVADVIDPDYDEQYDPWDWLA